MNARHLLLLPLVCLLVSCGNKPSEDAEPPHQDWVLASQVAFVEADGKTPRAVPDEPLRLWMPYVVGDLYGSPNAGELAPVDLGKDLKFTLDLNEKHLRLGKALVPTGFSQKWLTIEPAGARIARLLPYVLPSEGIAPLGVCEWIDADTGDRLMLVYFDRPGRIIGDVVYEGRSLRFDIEAKEAGFVWVRQPPGQVSGEYVNVPRPAKLALGVMP